MCDRDHARTIDSKSQLFISAYAKALEIIPRQLCDNAGFDATDVLNALRQKHAAGGEEGKNYGVDINTGARRTVAVTYGPVRRCTYDR